MAMMLVFIVFDLANVSSNNGDTKILLRPETIIGMIPDAHSETPCTTLMLVSGKSVTVAHTPADIAAKFGSAQPRIAT